MAKKASSKGIILEGKHYSTLTAAADAYGLTINKVSRRLKNGWSFSQAFGLCAPPRRVSPSSVEVIVENKKFASIKSAAEHYGISPSNVRARLKLGWSLDEALEIVARKEERPPMDHYREIVCEGVTFTSIGKLSEFYGLKYRLVYKRIRLGWTPEQAVGVQPAPPRFKNEDGSARETSWVKPPVIIEGKKFPDSSCGNFYLYIVENTINDKKYIGITTNSLATRFGSHKAAALKNEGKDRSLYNAMRKYGVENFSIRLLRSDAESIVELLEQEVEAIEAYDTRRNGYNTAYGGALGTVKPIEVQGVLFSSMGQAADFYGIEAYNFNQRITKLGWTPEQAAEIEERPAFGRRNKVYSVHHQGRTLEFSSQAQAAAHFGLLASTVNFRLRKGWTLEQALEIVDPPHGRSKVRREGYQFNGKHFGSVTELAAHTGVSVQALRRYLRETELTCEQAIFVLQNNLGRSMQQILVSQKCSYGEAYRQLSKCLPRT